MERSRTRRLSVSKNELIRSVPIHRILRRAAETFGSSEGRPEDYKLSAATTDIPFFLSHSWRASRWSKFFTLWVFFRLPAAVLGCICFSSLAFALTVTEVLPSMNANVTGRFTDLKPGGSPCSIWCSLFGFAGVFAGAGIQGFAERLRFVADKGCFLDKLCIHQKDSNLKQEGIRSLGLFLRRSEKMFILWSPEYFSRLWCCFEVAAFDKAAQEEKRDVKRDIILRPVQLGPALAVSFVSMNVPSLASQLLPTIAGAGGMGSTSRIISILLFHIVVNFVLSRYLFAYYRACADLLAQIKAFSFQKAECFAESDRTLLTKILTLWYSPDEQDSEAAIATFDTIVRTKLHSIVEEQVLADPLPYKLNLMVNIIGFSPFAWDVLASRVMVPSSMLNEGRILDHTCYAFFLLVSLAIMSVACTRQVFKIGWLFAPRRDVGMAEFTCRCLLTSLVHSIWLQLYQTTVVVVLFYGVALQSSLLVGLAVYAFVNSVYLLVIYKGGACMNALRCCASQKVRDSSIYAN